MANRRYAVTRLGGMGVEEIIIEDADSGDDAAVRAYKPGCKIIGVHPAQLDEPAGIKAARRGGVSALAAEMQARDA